MEGPGGNPRKPPLPLNFESQNARGSGLELDFSAQGKSINQSIVWTVTTSFIRTINQSINQSIDGRNFVLRVNLVLLFAARLVYFFDFSPQRTWGIDAVNSDFRSAKVKPLIARRPRPWKRRSLCHSRCSPWRILDSNHKCTVFPRRFSYGMICLQCVFFPSRDRLQSRSMQTTGKLQLSPDVVSAKGALWLIDWLIDWADLKCDTECSCFFVWSFIILKNLNRSMNSRRMIWKIWAK